MDSYDSGDDLFITQSSFRTIDTQDAADAAGFFDNSGELVEYWDFSSDLRNAETVSDVQSVSQKCETVTAVHAPALEDTVNVQPQPLSCEESAAIDVTSNVNVNLNVPQDVIAPAAENVVVGEEPFVALQPDFFDDDDTDGIDEDFLQEAYYALNADEKRHAAPVSDAHVAHHSGKRYVSILKF